MNFQRFWPIYVAEHRNRLNRRLHLAGTIAYLSLLAFLLFTARYRFLWSAPLIAYGFAWFGHFVIEKNRPATFKHPLLSLIGDHKMAALMMAGKMDAELERLEIVNRE
jgi:hypothetical protein